jgi:VanZ family protein
MQYRRTDDRVVEALALRSAVELGLIAALALALVATLAPFQLVMPAKLRVVVTLGTSDVLLNLGLLAPLGFLLGMRALPFGRSVMSPGVQAFVIGAGLSALLELAQLFVPVRCPSPIDVLANALGCALGCALHARFAVPAERALLRLLASPPSTRDVVLLALLLCLIALMPLDASRMRETFHWTLGPAPLTRRPQAFVIGLLGSLGLAAWLGFALRLRSRSALMASAYALPIVAAIEVCRGYNVLHAASLSTLTLAVLCALVSAHAAGRVRVSIQPMPQPARRIWV